MNTFFYYLSMIGIVFNGINVLMLLLDNSATSQETSSSLISIPLLVLFIVIYNYTKKNREKIFKK